MKKYFHNRIDTYLPAEFPLAEPASECCYTGWPGDRERWRFIISSIVLFIFAWRALIVLGTPDSLKKEEWRELAQYLENNMATDEIIVPRVLQIAVPLRFYLEEDLPQEVMEVNRVVTPLEDLVSGYKGVWLVYWNGAMEMPGHSLATQAKFDINQETDPVASKWIAGDGLEVLERKDFKGITVFHFIFEDVLSPYESNGQVESKK